MNTKSFLLVRVVGSVLSAALLPLLFGCVAGPDRSEVRVHSSGYLQADVMTDDYVYYPGYEVYYSNTHHNYVYRDGRNWVTRPAPPRVSVDVLLASPSVRADFHDSPAQHHSSMVKTYPKNWRPAAPAHEVKNEQSRDDKSKDNHDRKDEKNEDDKKRN